MTDNYSIPGIGCYLSKQFQTISLLKIFPCGYKNVGIGIQLSEIIAHLLRKEIGYGKQGFMMQSQTLALHCYGYHFIAFPCSHTMSKHRISAV